MRNRCGRAGAALVGPRLLDREDAVAALRLSAGQSDARSIVVLVCDGDDRVVLGVAFDGAPAVAVGAAIDCVLPALATRGAESSLVVGLFRAAVEPTELDRVELAAVQEMAAECDDQGVALLDVVVISGDTWQSVAGAGGVGYGRGG